MKNKDSNISKEPRVRSIKIWFKERACAIGTPDKKFFREGGVFLEVTYSKYWFTVNRKNWHQVLNIWHYSKPIFMLPRESIGRVEIEFEKDDV